MRSRARLRPLLAALLAAGLCAAAPSPREQAKGILAAAGVRGGLIVHLGCGDGRLTAALRVSDRYLVHGLDTDRESVAKARAHLRAEGLCGPVAVQWLMGNRLPYADGLVSLVVATKLEPVAMDEVMRVLSPGGVACVLRDGAWQKTVKPWPKALDEWTHTLHDPSNNAVGTDTVVAPPRRFQWIAGPRRARQHENMASVSAVVSAKGRIFSIQDEGSIASVVLPARWFLVARDAFNGVLLWRRKVGPWECHLRAFRQGPPDIARRLVASGDRVFVTLGYGKPLTLLDAATGETLKTYEGTAGTTEILHQDGTLYLVVGDRTAEAAAEAARRRGPTPPPKSRRIAVLDADSGAVRWQKSDADTATLMPTTLAVAGGRVFFQSHTHVLCLDARTGAERWRAERPVAVKRPGFSTPTLVVYGDVVLSADRATPELLKKEPKRKYGMSWVNAPKGELIAFAADTGKRLWSADCREVFNAPVDILVADGLIWTGEVVHSRDPGITQARDPLTGEIKRTRPKDQEFFNVGMPHHRCHRNRATNRYLVIARAGVEFIDVKSGTAIPNHWVRGTCQHGTIPCNGLLYAPPHSCACYLDAKLNGFVALSGQPEQPWNGPVPARLVKGPAFGAVSGQQSAVSKAEDWPTYRHDAERSGATKAAVPTGLAQRWATTLGGTLSSVTVAEGKVFVASVDAHTVHALDAATGKEAWGFTAGGRVDSPPTIGGGVAVFGCADGWVYCLRASDGALAWRFRAAPLPRHIVVREQVESVWPVHGSVLVTDGVASFAAGRSSYLDGGIRLVRLDLATGKILAETQVDSRDPKTGYQRKGVVKMFDIPGALPSVLSSDGERLYMRHAAFEPETLKPAAAKPHLYSPTGLLDDTWWHRSYWIVGTRYYTGYRDWFRAGREVPGGRMLVVADGAVYGYGRRPSDLYWTTPIEYHLFATSRTPTVVPSPQKRTRVPAWGQKQIACRWSQSVPLLARAMVLAGDVLFVAGPPDVVDEWGAYKTLPEAATQEALAAQEAALAGKSGALLRAVSVADGRTLAELKLAAPPAWDAMAAAGGRLFLAMQDGRVLCLAGRP